MSSDALIGGHIGIGWLIYYYYYYLIESFWPNKNPLQMLNHFRCVFMVEGRQ